MSRELGAIQTKISHMLNNKKIVVVMPAFNAEKTLATTYSELPHNIVDEVIVVDDCSSDNTVKVAESLSIKHLIKHQINSGYGANQKSCYKSALSIGADVVVMVHPDYQYDPRLVTAMASMVASGVFDCVLGSRILGTGAIKGGMPAYKYIANRALTFFQNLLIPYKLSEYHTGYRAFSRGALEKIPLEKNSNDFLFDNQVLLQLIAQGFRIGEVSCPTRYMKDASSISFWRSMKYGFGVVATTFEYKLGKLGLIKSKHFSFKRLD